MGKILKFIVRKVLLNKNLWEVLKKLYFRSIADSRITALRIVCIMTSTIMWMMMSFLTDTWKFDYTYAAGIRNVWSGLTIALPLILVHVSDTITGNFYMSSLGSLLYATGLGFLSASTPVISCIGLNGPLKCAEKESTYLYVGLILTVCGLACIETSLSDLELKDGASSRDRVVENLFEGASRRRTKTFPISCTTSSSSLITVAFFSMLILIYANVIKSWHARVLIATVFVSVQALNFVLAKKTYTAPTGIPKTPEKSLIVIILRVLVASTLKMSHPCVASDQLYKGDKNDQIVDVCDSVADIDVADIDRDSDSNSDSDNDDNDNDSDNDNDNDSERSQRGKIWELTSGMECLEKAAIIVQSQDPNEEKKNRWTLCTVGEVELTKMVLRMFPLWTTCILLGVISSIGDTYFLEQASHLDRRLGKLNTPLIALLGVQKIAGFIIASIFKNVTKQLKNRHIILAPLGVALAMVFSILCCIVAAIVENKRLNVVESHQLVDQQEHDIPMSLFWLIPQFVLLGGLNSMFEQGNAGFSRRFPKPVVRYVALSTTGINGIGRIGGFFSVYLVARITRGKNNESWFQSSLNKSRLDQYYCVLAGLSGLALAAYILVAFWHFYRESSRAVKENDEEHTPMIEICHWFCCG